MAPIPAYTAHYADELGDKLLAAHREELLTDVSHRLSCESCFDRLSGGSEDAEDVNRALDAQIDLLVQLFGGDPRIALARVTQSLGAAQKKLKMLNPDGLV